MRGFGVFIGAPRTAGQRDQQAQDKREPLPPVFHSHKSMANKPAAQNNHRAGPRIESSSANASNRISVELAPSIALKLTTKIAHHFAS